MLNYIIRRMLYAIPILIGINVIVFALFFYVNTPEGMARLHLGGKRITPEQIDAWKREHSLDLPYFYNAGWRRIGAVEARKTQNEGALPTAGTGTYRIRIESPDNEKFAQKRTVRIRCEDSYTLHLPEEFSATGDLELPADVLPREYTFNLESKNPKPSHIKLLFEMGDPAPTHRVVLDYKDDIGLVARFTRTIFAQRSLKMLIFDYGKSDRGNLIGEEILKRIGPSLTLTVPSFFMGLVLCIFFAMLVAFFRATYVDYWGAFLCVVGMSISIIFYIILGQVVMGKILRLFPISGFDYGLYSLKFLALPIFISVVGGLGGSVRFYRTIFLEELNRDYVRTAQSKGLSQSAVLFIHVLKNAMIPILTGVVVSLPFLYAGSLLLESFFSIPGMGAFLLDAIRQQDFAVVQAEVSLGSFIYVLALALTDICYTLVDPRVRLE